MGTTVSTFHSQYLGGGKESPKRRPPPAVARCLCPGRSSAGVFVAGKHGFHLLFRYPGSRVWSLLSNEPFSGSMASRDSSSSDWKTEGTPVTLSTAVREHLRKLCLREFPCGTGSWVRAPHAGGRGQRGEGSSKGGPGTGPE